MTTDERNKLLRNALLDRNEELCRRYNEIEGRPGNEAEVERLLDAIWLTEVYLDNANREG